MLFSTNLNSNTHVEKIEGIFSEQSKSNSIVLKKAYVADTELFSKGVFDPSPEVEKEEVSLDKAAMSVKDDISSAIDKGYEVLGRNKVKKMLKEMLEKMEKEDLEEQVEI